MQTEKPILFSAPMVRAILDGRKSQTRRAVKPAPPTHNFNTFTDAEVASFAPVSSPWSKSGLAWGVPPNGSTTPVDVRQPYRPGDSLYVRETWAFIDGKVFYRATEPNVMLASGYKWAPSIHMPKWAARLWLRCVDVRAERLGAITEEDARAEGVAIFGQEGGLCPMPLSSLFGLFRAFPNLPLMINLPADWMSFGEETSPPAGTMKATKANWRAVFAHLWTALYGPGAWEQSPWVWRIAFERIEKGA